MPTQNPDRSHSKIVVMPRWHETTQPAEIWFEAGVINYRDMSDPEEVRTASVYDFEERMVALQEMLEGEYYGSKIVCSPLDVQRFFSDVRELIKEAKKQLHVGLPIKIISEVEQSRAPISARSGFGNSRPTLQSAIGSFVERNSGLLIPTK